MSECPPTAKLGEWCLEEEQDPEAVFVDLVKNKESYTAFDGQQIWSAIYQDNCLVDKFMDVDISRTCSDHTLLYQLVSGLHTSINMHVAMNYYDESTHKIIPNHPLFLKGIGHHPERLKNLYFLYSLVLKAYRKAYPALSSFASDGVAPVDYELETLKEEKTCDRLFNEKYFFNEPLQGTLSEIRGKFLNISRLLDCVSCEKCRLNGKVQVKGLGTAMKLLFSQDKIKLKRTEAIVSRSSNCLFLGIGQSAAQAERVPYIL